MGNSNTVAISKIVITPITNIAGGRVINQDAVETREYNSRMDVFLFHNRERNEMRKGNLMDVSLYNDLIVENEIYYKILHMLTKNVQCDKVKRIKPCDCKTQNDINELADHGIFHNKEGISLIPGHAVITLNDIKVEIPSRRFKMMATWFLEEQEIRK